MRRFVCAGVAWSIPSFWAVAWGHQLGQMRGSLGSLEATPGSGSHSFTPDGVTGLMTTRSGLGLVILGFVMSICAIGSVPPSGFAAMILPRPLNVTLVKPPAATWVLDAPSLHLYDCTAISNAPVSSFRRNTCQPPAGVMSSTNSK